MKSKPTYEELEKENEILRKEKAEYKTDRFKLLSNLTFEGIIIHEQGKVVEINQSFAQMLGYKYDELINQNIIKLVIPQEYLDIIQKNIQMDYAKPYEVEARKKDRTLFPIEIESKNLIYNNEKIRVTAIRDITARKKTEYKRKESEERLNTFINTIPDIVYYKDGKGRWLLANEAGLELFCLSGVDYFNKTDAELAEFTDEIYKEAFSSCMISDEQAWNNKTLSHGIEIIPTVSGITKIYDVIKIPTFHSEGSRKGLAVIGRDITELKKQNAELKVAREKAEESDRLKSAFLANMSHEIRTPMNSILGFAGILKKSNKTAKQKEHFINVIQKSGNHLLNLINDIIDISKTDANQLTVIEKELNLNTFLLQVYEVFRNQINENVEIILHKDILNRNNIIITDETRLQQILTNLIGNAVKFTSSGTIEIGYSVRNDNMIEFYVKDTGIGISENELQFVFDRFRQADETSTRKYGGTGLGLAISKACAELLGGKIWAKSKHGKGSTFYFTIKYKSSKKQETTPKKQDDLETENSFEGKTILIAEDDIYSFQILELYLEPTNANIIHATDGLQTIDLCKNNPQIDIVLMDIQLPKLNGLEATKEILKFRPDLPIISQTANAMREDKTISLKAGCVDYVSKPISEETLHDIINKHLITS